MLYLFSELKVMKTKYTATLRKDAAPLFQKGGRFLQHPFATQRCCNLHEKDISF